MTTIRLVVEQDSLEVSPHGAVTGRIYFRLDADAFPDWAWNDFVLIVVGWWVHTVLQLGSDSCTEVELMFMDGPFTVRLHRHGDDQLLVEMCERSRDGRHRIAQTTIVSLTGLARDIAQAARVVLEFCSGHSVSGRDVEKLEHGLAAIEASWPE